jgi:nitrous oxidase accessory protein
MDNRKIGIVAILAFSIFTAFSVVPSVQASTIYVPDDYPTIQSAVDAAYPGDTINVGSGTYKENVIMDKKRTLIGDAFTTIDAQGKGGAINISADHCVVTGFRCVNATKSRCAGIKVESNWNRIENNTCEKNNYGICLKDSSNNTI